MEHDLVLEGRVVAPGGLEEMEIGVEGGIIRELGHGLKGARRIRAGRSLIFPGFVDIHVHLREPGWERKEDFRTGTRAAIHGGVTTVADMPNNPVPTTTVEALRLKSRLAKERALIDVMFYGGVSNDNPGDLGKIRDGVVGYKLYLSETTGARSFPEDDLAEVFRIVRGTGRPLSIHCEDQATVDKMQKMLQGEDRADAYCDIRPPQAETRSVLKVVSALKTAEDLTVNICHASTGETLSIIGRGRKESTRLQCEATLHHIYYNRRAMFENRMLKTNPPLRSEEDRLALIEGLRRGAVSFLVTDHAPHLAEEKESLGLAGVPGLDDYSHLVSWLIRDRGFNPVTLAEFTSGRPARFLGLGDRGEIAVGRRADVTMVDLHAPEIVRNDQVMSKCGWSPYEGKEFPGRARWVVGEGEVLMDDFELA